MTDLAGMAYKQTVISALEKGAKQRLDMQKQLMRGRLNARAAKLVQTAMAIEDVLTGFAEDNMELTPSEIVDAMNSLVTEAESIYRYANMVSLDGRIGPSVVYITHSPEDGMVGTVVYPFDVRAEDLNNSLVCQLAERVDLSGGRYAGITGLTPANLLGLYFSCAEVSPEMRQVLKVVVIARCFDIVRFANYKSMIPGAVAMQSGLEEAVCEAYGLSYELNAERIEEAQKIVDNLLEFCLLEQGGYPTYGVFPTLFERAAEQYEWGSGDPDFSLPVPVEEPDDEPVKPAVSSGKRAWMAALTTHEQRYQTCESCGYEHKEGLCPLGGSE